MTSAARIGQRESVSSDTGMKIVIAGGVISMIFRCSPPRLHREDIRKPGSHSFLSRVPRRIEVKSNGNFSSSNASQNEFETPF